MRGIATAVFAGVALVAGACAYTPRTVTPVLGGEAQSSKIFAADGTLVTTLHAEQNRELVPLDHIARPLQDAVVAIEDERFWHHGGVDLRALLRAARADARSGKVVEGGSTITEQYVKNTLLDARRTVHRKLREASLAVQLEHKESKRQILEGYLNTVYFGNGAYGAQAAAGVYFGTGADHLTLAQAATLAGLIRSPAGFDPYTSPAAAMRRRDVVLDKLVALRWADRAAAVKAKATGLGVVPLAGPRYPAPYFVEQVKRFVLDDPAFGPTATARQAALFRGGLRIHTTLDLTRQTEAERAVATVLSKPDQDPAGALVSLDPATQGRRPAGSSFKPLVLAAALLRGVPLSKTYSAPAHVVLALPDGRSWSVENYEDRAGGTMNLVDATVHSINTVYAQLILDVGPAYAVSVARRMGVASPLLPYPSAVLGTNDVTALDMATAYATIANRGMRVTPTFVTSVTSADGTALWQHHVERERALPTWVADREIGVLQQVVQRGTGVQARIGRPVAGKTGTGEKWRDAWFVGFTPDLVTSVWVGFPDAQRSMVPPTTRIRVTGGSWPAQIWQLYTGAALAQVPARPFAPAEAGSLTPTEATQVPSVLAMPYDLAVSVLTDAGLRAVRVDVANGDYPPGVVLGQSPPAGATVEAGSTVTLEAATGTGPTTTETTETTEPRAPAVATGTAKS